MKGKTSLQKAWEVLFPYLPYYLAYNVAYLVLAFVYQTTVRFGGAYGQFMTAHAANVAGVMGGLCMLAGILPVVPMLKEELRGRGETLCPATKKEAGNVLSAAAVGTAGGTGKVEAGEDAAGDLSDRERAKNGGAHHDPCFQCFAGAQRVSDTDRVCGQFPDLPEGGGQAVRRGFCVGACSLWADIPAGGGGRFPRCDLQPLAPSIQPGDRDCRFRASLRCV